MKKHLEKELALYKNMVSRHCYYISLFICNPHPLLQKVMYILHLSYDELTLQVNASNKELQICLSLVLQNDLLV
jgi:hypothetical protein